MRIGRRAVTPRASLFALEVLLRLVRPGGLLLVSTRTHYYEKSEYRGVVDDLLGAGRMQLVELLKDAPYNVDGDAHYWVFKKSA